MNFVRSKILYFLLPLLLLGGAIALIGSVKKENNDSLRHLSTQASTVSLDPPGDLNFAGEIVPLRDFEVKERLDAELIRYIYLHSATIMNIKRAGRWQPEISKILKEEGVPEDFFYLCVAESHLANATSSAGAKGFWQFMESTGKMYGLEINDQVDERHDPIKSTRAACAYIKDAHRMFKNWTLVAASYNMGMGGLKKQMDRQHVDNYYDLYLNRETAAYLFRILAIKTVLTNPEDYGFKLGKQQVYAPLKFKTVKVDTSITDIINFAIQHNTTYKMIKVLNPWLLGDNLILPKPKQGEVIKVYEIAIPLNAKADDSGMSELIPGGPVGAADTLRTDSASKTPKPGTGQVKKPEPKVDPKGELKPEPKSELKPDPQPKLKAEPQPKLKADPQPELKAEPQPELKDSIKPVKKKKGNSDSIPKEKAATTIDG